MTNPDMGRIEKEFDLAGNLTKKITPNLRELGAAIEYDYDYSRPTQIRYPYNAQNNVSYEYGSADLQGNGFNQVGRVVKVTHGAGSDEYAYNKLGQIAQHNRTVNLGNKTPSYRTEYVYDPWGRLHTLVYPDGEVLTYGYNAGGMVTSATGEKEGVVTTYLKAMAYDKFEQRIRMEQGNGVVTNYAYSAETRRLANLKSVRPGNNLMQNLNYSYDKVGNITRLANDTPVNSSATMGGPEVQVFEYDSLYRLTKAQGEFEYAPGDFHRYSMDMEYDEIHNIKRKTQSHVLATSNGGINQQQGTSYDWTYDYSGSPHAPTHIGNRSYFYDGNGNQTGYATDGKGSSRTMYWDEENRLKAVADGGGAQQYIYDAGGQRVIKDGKQGTTVYVNNYFIVKNGSTVSKHIFVGTSRLATTLSSGGNQTTNDGGLVQTTYTDPTVTTTATQDPAAGSTTTDPTATTATTTTSSNGNGGGRANNPTIGNHPGQGVTNRSEQAATTSNNVDASPTVGSQLGDYPWEKTQTGGGGISNSVKQSFYYHPDHLGSTSYVTDKDGELFEHVGYFALGETWYEESNNGAKIDFLFTSKELDSETGLYYFGARYYDPRTSVWQSPDPILEQYLPTGNSKQDENLLGMGGVYNSKNLGLYTYAHHNSVKLLDPDGRATNPLETVVLRSHITDSSGNQNHRPMGSMFGPVRTKVVNGNVVPKNHNGLDLRAVEGTNVLAMGDGEVVEVNNDESSPLGKYVVYKFTYKYTTMNFLSDLIHPSQWGKIGARMNANGKTFYALNAHLSSTEGLNTTDNNKIKEGQVIGKTGSTGSTTNNQPEGEDHLHFGIYTAWSGVGNVQVGDRVDPLNLVRRVNIKPVDNRSTNPDEWQ